MSNFVYSALIVAIIAFVTAMLRFLPFLVFGKNQKTPEFISYLGKVLPYSIMGMLVVYCLKGISFASFAGFVPSMIAVACVVILHVWKRQTLLSILGGTVIYMVLINFM